MSIIVTGANGKLGSLIIEQLLRTISADQIIAGVRHPQSERARSYIEQGIQVRLCDYDQPETLHQSFDGVSKLLLISSSNPDDTIRLRQHIHVIEAAKKCKIEHLLYTSFAFLENGTDFTSLHHLHLATEHAILTTGLPYTFLRNGLYIDFVGVLGLDAAIASGELCIYPGKWKFNSVTRLDLAIGIATILCEPGHENMTYELTAPRSWTFEELAAALSNLTRRSISLRQDPQIQNWIYGFLAKIDTTSTSDDLERFIGSSVTTLTDSIKPFIEQHIPKSG